MSHQDTGWRGSLDLLLQLRSGRTQIGRQTHEGPLQVQRPFYPEGDDLCHVYLLHPPGGLVGGDELTISVGAEVGARALVTTPAATKLYRSRDEAASSRVVQRLAVAAGASIEWLPQETIAFDGSRAMIETKVDVAAGGAFLGWEILCVGRPAADETFSRGACSQAFEIWRGADPLCIERAHMRGGSTFLQAAWGLAGHAVAGTLLCTPAPAGCLDDLRALASTLAPGDRAGATILRDVVACRFLGRGTERARAHLARAWGILRPAWLGRQSVPPRIWAT